MSDRPEDQQWNEDVGQRRHGRNWIADEEAGGQTGDAGKPVRYGDERDEAFEADETSEPGSMSPPEAKSHPADRGEPWQVGQRDGKAVITEGNAEDVAVPGEDE